MSSNENTKLSSYCICYKCSKNCMESSEIRCPGMTLALVIPVIILKCCVSQKQPKLLVDHTAMSSPRIFHQGHLKFFVIYSQLLLFYTDVFAKVVLPKCVLSSKKFMERTRTNTVDYGFLVTLRSYYRTR